MLLVCNLNLLHIIECILCFIEENSVLVGVITSVIVSSRWFKQFIRQKRAEAFFGFYAKLSLRLKALQTKLVDSGQLNVSDAKAGNIFSLMYTDELREKICPKYREPKEMDLYRSAAKELKEILLNTDNNVYPQGSDPKEWYESQHILFDFCEFLENKAYHQRTNKELGEGESEPKHIIKCRLLINAMDNIQKSINNAHY
ncbi:MAG: hypothetical protein NC124_19775 [Clostridium sp.]|nr:hypothetical protein [Clostridium sp.]